MVLDLLIILCVLFVDFVREREITVLLDAEIANHVQLDALYIVKKHWLRGKLAQE